MTNEKPDLNALVNAGSNAAKPDAESKPAPIDLSSVGGVLIASPPTGSGETVDIAHLYGEFGGPLE
jgi:hypothetical protein